MNVLLLLIMPLLTALLVLPAKGLAQVRQVALWGSVLQLLLSVALLYVYLQQRAAGNDAPFLLEWKHTWYGSLGISFHAGVDGISLAMILLTAVVVLAGVLVSWHVAHMSKEFFFLLLLLATGAYGFFMALDLFTLFFFLEVAVLPKFLLIGIWGSGKKEYSAMKLALMLMGGSALVLIGLLGLYFGAPDMGRNHMSLLQFAETPIAENVQLLFFPFAFLGFGIFTALFPFHTWVPDGHSSAPTAASMFLAGISMKLGGYGCLRVATWLMPYAAKEYSLIIVVLAAIAILYGAFATMMQTDLKYMNAYSSVSHTGFVLLGIGMLTQTAINGAVLQMISHGLMTALFFAVIGMIYERTHTREVAKLGGLLKVMPFIATVFVITGLCSLGLPGLSGFVAEMTVFVGAWERVGTWYRIATLAGTASIVVTAVYILRATGASLLGPLRKEEYVTLSDARWNERLAAMVLLVGILLMGLAPFLFRDLIGPGTELIMQKIQPIVQK